MTGVRTPPVTRCPICDGSSRCVSDEFDGYVEGYRVSIMECQDCGLRHGSRLDIPAGLYDAIYEHAAMLPGYDRYARYAATIAGQPDALDRLAAAELPYWFVRQHLARHLPDGGRIIDLGSGEGYLTYALRQAGYTCWGVDVSTDVVQRARRRFSRADWFYTPDELANAGVEPADLVVALELIEHVPQPVQFLQRAGRYLADAGTVLLTTPNRDASPAGAVWDTDLPPVHLHWFGQAAMTALARRAGFTVRFPAAPTSVPAAGQRRRDGTWPALLTESGEPSLAVRRTRSLSWRALRRFARGLGHLSRVLEHSPMRAIPAVPMPSPSPTLAALLSQVPR
jgi:SAM-dependent methyltransferase